jgi:hypothetical protein
VLNYRVPVIMAERDIVKADIPARLFQVVIPQPLRKVGQPRSMAAARTVMLPSLIAVRPRLVVRRLAPQIPIVQDQLHTVTTASVHRRSPALWTQLVPVQLRSATKAFAQRQNPAFLIVIAPAPPAIVVQTFALLSKPEPECSRAREVIRP